MIKRQLHLSHFSPLNTIERLHQKYDFSFNFYQAKSINQIIFNCKSNQVALAAKDVAILVNTTQYLKRVYSYLNQKGKHQIRSRLHLLTNFYATNDILKYEYPMMIITQTKDIFQKRRKRIKRIKEDQGSSDSSNKLGQQQSIFCEESILKQLDQSISIIQTTSKHKNQDKKQKYNISYSQQYYIYREDSDVQTNDFAQKISTITHELQIDFAFTAQQDEQQVSHLVLDFDDVDTEKVMQQYKKISNKQNVFHLEDFMIPIQQNGRSKTKIKNLVDKTPNDSSIHIQSKDRKQSTQKQKLTSMNLLLGSREERNQQLKIMKKSLHQFETKVQSSHQRQLMPQQSKMELSALFQFMTERKPSHSILLKDQQNQIYRNLDKQQKLKNFYGSSLMKQSQIMPKYRLEVPKLKSAQQMRTIYQDLNHLKETPIQFVQNNIVTKDKSRFRVPQGLIRQQKQTRLNELPYNIRDHYMIHPYTHHQPQKQIKKAKSGHVKYSSETAWYQQHTKPGQR